MIDFRYHLVSLVAVFLAIALGVVIGTTASDAAVPADAGRPAAAAEGERGALEDRVAALEGRLATAEDFEQAVAPALVRGSLAGRSVLLLATGEDVPAERVRQVATLVTDAGGTVGGVVRLTAGYTDPAGATGLRTYVTSPGIPAGVQLPTTDDAGQLVAALLAQSLTVPEPGAAAPDPAAASSVLAGLAALEVLSVETPTVTPADSVVVLTGAGPASEDAAERTATLVELVTALDAAGSGAVVAGPSAAAEGSGLVAAVRAAREVSAVVSTVDDVERASGRISTVLAVAQEALGTSGAYGAGEGTRPVPPVPAATP